MKKFTKLFLIVSVVFFLAACGGGDGGFKIPSLSSYGPGDAPNHDFTYGGEAFPDIETALEEFERLAGLLMSKYEDLNEGISDIIESKGTSNKQTVKLNLGDYNDDFNDDGIFKLSGSVTASWDNTSNSKYQKSDFNVSHSYYSNDDEGFYYLSEVNFKMKAKGYQEETESMTTVDALNIREEALAISYAISFDSDEYSGKAVSNFGFAWADRREKNFPADWSWVGWLKGPYVMGNVKFYDKDNKFLFDYTFTEEEALAIFGLDDKY